MRDIAAALRGWQAAGTRFALATVVGVQGSAPRGPGAAMAVDAAGTVVGSLSGGCVEGAVYETAMQVLESDRPVLTTYGISDDNAFAIGLTCGGVLEVLVRPVNPQAAAWLGPLLSALGSGTPLALATVVTGPAGPGAAMSVWADGSAGGLGDDGLDRVVAADALGHLALGATETRHYGRTGERRDPDVRVFIESFAPPPKLLIFGAVDFARALCQLGAFLGYRVTVCDARPVFATKTRFPEATEVRCEWPDRYLAAADVDERTAICVLTHDPKFDVPALVAALRGPAGYVGAMGSRRTHEDRLRRLRAAGLSDAELDRLSSPIGLDLGARTPQETAVAIAAELIQHRCGGSGRPLRTTSGEIHGRALAPVPSTAS